MDIKAEIKYLRISPKKIKALAKKLVGLTPREAIDRLSLLGTKGAGLLVKSIESAKANAINNLKLGENTLRIKTIMILKGPFLKRWQPVSKGIAHQIKKRMAHLRVVLTNENKEVHGQKS